MSVNFLKHNFLVNNFVKKFHSQTERPWPHFNGGRKSLLLQMCEFKTSPYSAHQKSGDRVTVQIYVVIAYTFVSELGKKKM